jgi:hypothetical protein
MEITTSHPSYRAINFSNVQWTELQLVALHKLLLEMGAARNMRLFMSSDGTAQVITNFKHPLWNKDDLDNGEAEGTQFTPLHAYIRGLIRFDRSQHKRMKNVESKIQRMIEKGNKLSAEIFGR